MASGMECTMMVDCLRSKTARCRRPLVAASRGVGDRKPVERRLSRWELGEVLLLVFIAAFLGRMPVLCLEAEPFGGEGDLIDRMFSIF